MAKESNNPMTKTGLTYFKKGSKAAKKHMARLRAMRGKKKSKRRNRKKNFPAVDLLVGAAAVKSMMSNPRRRNVGGTVDPEAATELQLYIESDRDLYFAQFIPIVKNLMRRRGAGTFDAKKAVKLFMYLVDTGAKKYMKEVADAPKGKWHEAFSKATRLQVAQDLTESFITEADLGNYDHYLPKKYRKNPSRRTQQTKTHAKFVRERLEPPGKFARRSFRTIIRGKKEIVIGCPKGHWDAKKKRCKVGTRAQSILHPMTKKAMEKVQTNPRFMIGRGAKNNPQEKDLNYIVFGWSRDPNIGRVQLAGGPRGTLRFKKKSDAIKLAKQQLKGIYDRTWVESVIYYKDTGWTPYDIVFKSNPDYSIGRGPTERKLTTAQARRMMKNNPRQVKRNPILQTVGLAAANPPHPIEIPFRPGQKISIAKARAWVESTGDRELKKQFEAAYRLQCKANWKPKYVRWQVFPMGDSKRIDAVTALVHYGKTDATLYKPPKGSKKGNHYYKHEWGEGKGRRRDIPLLASSDGKLLLSPLMKGQVADDWLRG